MSSSAGWYPDPGGEPGLYRWWTGSAWTPSVTANPQDTPAPGSTATPDQIAGAPRKPGRWIASGVALVCVVLAVMLVRSGMEQRATPLPVPTSAASLPTPTPSASAPSPTTSPMAGECPSKSGTTMPTTRNRPGWISSGKLAFPALNSPWETSWEDRVPWGSRAMMQTVTDQANYDGHGNDWMASVLVSDIFVGDGFADTEVAAETILTCILGVFYSDTAVTAKQVGSTRHDVDGRNGWLIEAELGFDIPGLKAKGERVLVLVVITSDADYGLFYASIPDTKKALLPAVRGTLRKLQVL